MSIVIKLNFNSGKYTYDVYHIVKSFLPGAEIAQQISPDQTEDIRVEMDSGKKFSISEVESKHVLNLKLYEWLSEMTGKQLTWGILTGIRPTKIAMKQLEEGIKEEEILQYLKEHNRVSEQKAKLCIDIAKCEKALLKQLDYEEGYSLYIGIPFCPTTCSYCSFTSYPIAAWKNRVEEYLDALCIELTFIGTLAKEKHKKLNTIYIGGGTPTTLEPKQLDRLLSHVEHTFSYENLKEITVEAGRPDSITADKLEVLRNHHISRISINPQSMQQKTLNVIGRKHTVEDIKRVYQMAREKGFDNINMDLIAGLPGECEADMEDTLKQIKALAPDSLTVHALALKRASRMGQEQKQSITGNGRDEKEMAKVLSNMIDMAAKCAEEMQLFPYYMYRQKNIAGNFENVGYAKEGKAGIYNILIMEEKQTIVAAGAGASTKLVLPNRPEYADKNKKRIERVENVKDVEQYISRIDEMIERKGELLWP